jgi:hypothetical protein
MHLVASSAASQAAPGVLGFLVFAGMGVVLFFLFRSMTKHLRKVAVDPRQDPVAASSTPANGTAPVRAAPGRAGSGRVATGDSVSDGQANDGGSGSGED